MKTAIRTILCAAAVVMASVSCQKSIEPATLAEEGKETIDICVNGLMGEYTQVDGTKAELVNTVRVSWKGGEIVYVYDGTKCLGSLKASREGTEDRYAILSTDGTHTVDTPADGTTTLTLVYSPLLTKAPAVSNDAISISLASQSGAKAPFVAYATLEYTGTTIKNAVVPFQFATSVIKVNCTGLKPGTAITSATLSNVNTECKLTLSGTTAPSVSGDINGTITRTGDSYFAADKVNEEGVAVFQIAAPKLGEASEVRVLTIAQGSDEFEYKNFSKKALSAATSVNTVCQLVKALPAGALPGVFTVSNDDGQTTKQIYFSQGNLWYGKDGEAQTATFNFEANQYDTTPTSTGDWDATHVSHFYWSKDVAEAVKIKFVWDQQSRSDSDVFFTNDPKDATKPNVNFTVNVGGTEQTGWRTLSTKEWQYLFKTRSNASNLYKCGFTVCGKTNCVVLLPDNWEWDETADEHNVGTGWQDGGYPETQTGNEVTWKKMEDAGAVCLPAASKRDDSNVGNVGADGYYWSSTAPDDYNAGCVRFNKSTVGPGFNVGRDSGCSVRLITECQ